MLRSLALATVLVAALGACDSAPYPAPTNPYDPAHPGARRVSAPTALDVVATTPTSVTLAWPDPSSFETGFRVEVAELSDAPAAPLPTFRTVATLLPGTVTFDATGLFGTLPLAFRVVALGERGDESTPSPEARIRYPGIDRTLAEYSSSTTSLVSLDGRTAYFGVHDTPEYTSAYAANGLVRLGEVGGASTFVGRFGTDGAVVVGRPYVDPIVPYRVLSGGSALVSGDLDVPDDEWGYRYGGIGNAGRRAVSADGQHLVGSWMDSSDRWQYGVWDLASGHLLPNGLGRIQEPRFFHGVTAGGRLISTVGWDPDSPELRADDVATGEPAWSLTLRRPVGAAPSLDLNTGRILAPDGDGYLLLDAETGRPLRRFAPDLGPTFEGRVLVLQRDRAILCGPEGPPRPGTPFSDEVCHVLDGATGERLRSITVGVWAGRYPPFQPTVPDIGASADTFVLAVDRTLVAVPLAARWELVR